MNKKLFLLLIVFLVGTVALAGCTSLTTSSESQTNGPSTTKYKPGDEIQKSTLDGAYDKNNAWVIIRVNNDGTYTVGQIYYDRNENKWWKSDEELPKFKFIGAIERDYPELIGHMNWDNIPTKYTYKDCSGIVKYSWTPHSDCSSGGDYSTPSTGYSTPTPSTRTPSNTQSTAGTTSVEISRNTLSYINTLRQREGKSPLAFDSRVYNLALARTNDMVKFNYLDHVNPKTGTCPDNMKYQYGFSSNEYLAENAYGTSRSYWNGIEKDAVDRWMTSTGHHFNLMYDHSAGAVACSNGYCVFLGLNNDRFGEGCHTAAEGIAYWNSRS